jgi:hypothetical protein
MEDRLIIKNKPHLINTMLSNLSDFKPLPYNMEEFSKICISNISESLPKAHGNTHLINSLKPILDYFQPIILICDSGRLMWSLLG